MLTIGKVFINVRKIINTHVVPIFFVILLCPFCALAEEQGCNSVNEWHYCFKQNHKPACPAGCYCEDKEDVQAVVNISGISNEKDVKYACAIRDTSKKDALEASGVHYCPEGKTHDATLVNDSFLGTRDNACWFGETAYDGSYNCVDDVNSGHYCLKRGLQKTCPAGCYCSGSKNAIGEQWKNGDIWQDIPIAS